jgi:hypothetical protein
MGTLSFFKEPLISKWWKDNQRIQEAALTPCRPMQKCRDRGTEALFLLQGALLLLEGEPAFDGAGTFGPFDLGNEHESLETCFFGPRTQQAVRDFQSQVVQIENIDGIAGVQTLHFMDDLLALFFETPLEVLSQWAD